MRVCSIIQKFLKVVQNFKLVYIGFFSRLAELSISGRHKAPRLPFFPHRLMDLRYSSEAPVGSIKKRKSENCSNYFAKRKFRREKRTFQGWIWEGSRQTVYHQDKITLSSFFISPSYLVITWWGTPLHLHFTILR